MSDDEAARRLEAIRQHQKDEAMRKAWEAEDERRHAEERRQREMTEEREPKERLEGEATEAGEVKQPRERAMVPESAPRTVAFFSYTRDDDRRTRGVISKIRAELEDAIASYHGRHLEVFQDVADIEGGEVWRERLEQALAEATIFATCNTGVFLFGALP